LMAVFWAGLYKYIVLASVSISVTMFWPWMLFSTLIFLFFTHAVEVVTELSDPVVTMSNFMDAMPADLPSKPVTELADVWLGVVAAVVALGVVNGALV
jgi:hypothetical protein